jgi:hypothetical protein
MTRNAKVSKSCHPAFRSQPALQLIYDTAPIGLAFISVTVAVHVSACSGRTGRQLKSARRANQVAFDFRVQSHSQKYFLFTPDPNHFIYCSRLVPPEGRLAIVTDAGRDAVDVDAPITNGAEADGEGVWS